MEIERYGRLLRRWSWLIVVLGLIAAGTAGAVSYQQPKVYQATTVALVNPTQQVLPTPQGGQDVDTLVQTYVRLVSVAPVREALVRGGAVTSDQALGMKILATREVGTTVVDINIQSPDPQAALSAAQAVVTAFNGSLDQLQQEVQGASPTARLQAMVPVQTPTSAPATPVAPKPLRDAIIALAAGLGLGVMLAVLLERLDNTVKTDYDVRLKLSLPLLGTVSFNPALHRSGAAETAGLVTVTAPADPLSESYRALRTNLLFNGLEKPLRTIVITSTIPGEGKTMTAANIAVVMAQAGTRVILVDADFRRPDLHRVFGLKNVGLGNLILLDRDESELIQAGPVPNLRVVCAGPNPPNPSELVGSTSMARVAERLLQLCDVLIYDTPPVAAVTDATVLAAHADGTILVIEQGRTAVTQVARARDTLQAVGARVLGAVLNKQPLSQAADYYVQFYGPDGQGRRRKSPPRSRRREDRSLDGTPGFEAEPDAG